MLVCQDNLILSAVSIVSSDLLVWLIRIPLRLHWSVISTLSNLLSLAKNLFSFKRDSSFTCSRNSCLYVLRLWHKNKV